MKRSRDIKEFRTPSQRCPFCRHTLDAVSGDRKPRPGDVSICGCCIEVLRIDKKLKLRKLTLEEERLLKADPLVQKARYRAQLTTMCVNGRKWLDKHPGAEIKIQFNFPQHVGVMASISEAIEKHFISADVAGLELLKSFWRWDLPSEPTVIMCRTALNLLGKI